MRRPFKVGGRYTNSWICMSGKRTQCPPPPHTNPREKAIIVGKQRRDANTLGTHYTHIYFYTILRVFMLQLKFP